VFGAGQIRWGPARSNNCKCADMMPHTHSSRSSSRASSPAGQVGATPPPGEPGVPVHAECQRGGSNDRAFEDVIVKTGNNGDVNPRARCRLGSNSAPDLHPRCFSLQHNPFNSTGIGCFPFPVARRQRARCRGRGPTRWRRVKAFPQDITYATPFDKPPNSARKSINESQDADRAAFLVSGLKS